MSQAVRSPDESDPYQNDHRLIEAYLAATQLDQDGMEGLCPSYFELSQTEDRYQDQELLGMGALKRVYRTFDQQTRRWVAMAQLREDRGPEFYDLFVNEAWLTSTLNHPNIINVHDVGIDSNGRPFFTMDIKGNTTFADLIAAKERNQRLLLQDFLKVCDAVAYAHSRQIIHLDLKPENIQSDAFGEVLVCDWGLGKTVSQPEEDELDYPTENIADNMTLLGEVKGSLGYMAPEQVESGSEKDHRTDIFSLGCILHAILTGEPPFSGSCDEILESTSLAIVSNPCEKYPSLKIPPSLGAVVLKALAKDPTDRYQTVSELKNDLQLYLDGFSTNAEDSNFFREALLFASRNRAPVLISSLALISLTVLSTLFIQKVDRLSNSLHTESQLAEHYASEAELANDLYIESLSKSEEERIALSKSLLSSVKRLKQKGIFDTPIKSIREALALAHHALALSPKSETAKYQICALNLIQLNFKEALKYPIQKGTLRYSYMSFAESFPEFDYHRTNRPSVETICEFLQKAREIESDQDGLIERMISYDSKARTSKNSYHTVILELLNYINPKPPQIEISYHPEDSEVRLRTDGRLRMIADPGGSNECVLRYLNPQSLVLQVDGQFDLMELNGLAIRELDLSRCPSFKLEEPLSLPLLETVKTDSQNRSAHKLKRWIQSSNRFKIVGTPTQSLSDD